MARIKDVMLGKVREIESLLPTADIVKSSVQVVRKDGLYRVTNVPYGANSLLIVAGQVLDGGRFFYVVHGNRYETNSIRVHTGYEKSLEEKEVIGIKPNPVDDIPDLESITFRDNRDQCSKLVFLCGLQEGIEILHKQHNVTRIDPIEAVSQLVVLYSEQR